MNDDQILEKGGTEEDIFRYAENNGADLTKEDLEHPDCDKKCNEYNYAECPGTDGKCIMWSPK